MSLEKVSQLRKTTARVLTESEKIPFTTFWKAVDASKLLAYKDQYKLDAMCLYALTGAVLDMPEMNVGWIEDRSKDAAKTEVGIWHHESVHLGFSLNDRNNNVVVVTIREPETKTLWELNDIVLAFREKAKTGKFAPEDFDPKPNIVFNNFGVVDVDCGVPKSLPWASLTLTAFRIKKTPIVVGDDIAVCPMMNVAVTFDHRPFDGVKAAKLLNLFKNKLENFWAPRGLVDYK